MLTVYKYSSAKQWVIHDGSFPTNTEIIYKRGWESKDVIFQDLKTFLKAAVIYMLQNIICYSTASCHEAFGQVDTQIARQIFGYFIHFSWATQGCSLHQHTDI